MPLIALEITRDVILLEKAKRKAPVTAKIRDGAKVFLAPYLSRKTPTGNCASPNEIKYTEVIKPRSAGESEKVSTSIGDIAALALPKSTDTKYPKAKGMKMEKNSGVKRVSFVLFINTTTPHDIIYS